MRPERGDLLYDQKDALLSGRAEPAAPGVAPVITSHFVETKAPMPEVAHKPLERGG